MKTRQRALDTAGWLGSIFGLILMPKCALCFSAYLALGSGAIWAGKEICGGAPEGGFLGALASHVNPPPVVSFAITTLSVSWILWRAGRFTRRFLRRQRRRDREAWSEQTPDPPEAP